jgi:hypothetical protein
MAGAKGMNQIVGSSAISQAATKVISVAMRPKVMENTIYLDLQKSRFTSKPGHNYAMKLNNSRLEPAA